MTLSDRSRTKLAGVHPDLIRVLESAANAGCKFHVTEGLRSAERQKQLLAAGKSTTLKSRHLTGHAFDVVAVTDDGDVSYADADMARVAAGLKMAATVCNIPLEWGGDWKRFCDTPHFQLPHKQYPVEGGGPEPAQMAVAVVPDKPLVRSGTVWGGVGAIGASGAAYADGALKTGLEWSSTLTEMAPIKGAMLEAGGNAKALALGLGIFAGMLVLSRRVKAKMEGKSA